MTNQRTDPAAQRDAVPDARARPARRQRRAWPWRSVTVSFAAGVAVSQFFGLWVFLATIVQGIPAPEWNGTATLVRLIAPEASARLKTLHAAGAALDAPRGCTTLALPERGLKADASACPSVAEAGLREIPGAAPKNNRLAVVKPLQMTRRAVETAPVAGWAARIGDGEQKSAVSAGGISGGAAPATANNVTLGDTVRATSNDPAAAGSWATVATPEN
ncbi:MAG: hypothetical protein AAGG99_02585 [Pseudomonadota bacterium]